MGDDYDFGFDAADDLKSAIYQAIGAASTSWENFWNPNETVNTGVFMEDRAKDIAEQLHATILRRLADGETL